VTHCALDVGDCALRAGSSGGCALCDALYTGGRGDVRRMLETVEGVHYVLELLEVMCRVLQELGVMLCVLL